jgi:hypothetical protein
MAGYFELGMERPFLVKVTSFLEDSLSFMGGAQGHSHQRGDSEKGDRRRPLKEQGFCGNGAKKRDPNPQSRPKKPFKPQRTR